MGFGVVHTAVTWDHFVHFVEYAYYNLKKKYPGKNIVFLYDGAKSHVSLGSKNFILNKILEI